MSKHAVADLGQRAHTLAPAVENGGQEAVQKAESSSSNEQLAVTSFPTAVIVASPPAITRDPKPSLSPPSPHCCQVHILSHLKTSQRDKRNVFRFPVVKDNKASPWSPVKFNGSVFSPCPYPTHHRPPHFGKNATAWNSFTYTSTFWGGKGDNFLITYSGYKYLTLFSTNEK